MRSLVAGLALASLTVLAATGCAAPEEPEDVGDAAGAAVGAMPERTTLHGAGGLIAYFDGGWQKPTVTLYRGKEKQTLRCEADRFRLEGYSDGYIPTHTAKTTLRCFDTPAGSTAAEQCQVIFNRKVTIRDQNQAEAADDLEVACWNGDRTTAKQTKFLKFVLGDIKTTTVPNKDRTEPTAELTYANGITLATKNVGTDVDADPYAFSWTLVSAVREVAYRNVLTNVDVSSPGATVSMTARDREYKPIAAKSVTLVDGGKVVAYPEMLKRIRAGFGIK